MKRAAVALGSLVTRIVSDVFPEGAFLLAGTALLAVGASFVSPAGPWIVVGVVCLATGIALTLPRRAA